jgi:glycosyltransferase involved in cell wall biosynthesis
MQENRIISNYSWLARRRLNGPMVAYWGHGANFQSTSRAGLRERWKRLLINQVDYWFAYTEATVRLLRAANFPEDRITTLNNSIDTDEFRDQCAAVDNSQILALRTSLGVPIEAPLGLFCGSLYAEKKLDLLIAAADLVKDRLPDFHLGIIGAGPALPQMQEAAQTRSWLHLVGVRTGAEKAKFFRSSQVMLNPGLVGLHILDSFVAGLPMVSTRQTLHSPEISYLEDGINGLLTDDTPRAYADGVLRILVDREFGGRMATAAQEASRHYSVANMANNFVDGIESCLRLGKKRH